MFVDASRGVLLQSEIAADLAHEVIGTVTGMQDDIDSTYSLRQLVEDAISAYGATLEDAYNRGEPWPAAIKLRRGGINPKARAAGDVEPLRSWIAPHIRGRCFGTVNAMKARHPTYTLRDFLETALSDHIADLKRQHGRNWIPADRLRRGPPRKHTS